MPLGLSAAARLRVGTLRVGRITDRSVGFGSSQERAAALWFPLPSPLVPALGEALTPHADLAGILQISRARHFAAVAMKCPRIGLFAFEQTSSSGRSSSGEPATVSAPWHTKRILMRSYRCYLLDATLHISAAKILECADDDAAARLSREVLAANQGCYGVEVWDSARRVYLYEHHAAGPAARTGSEH